MSESPIEKYEDQLRRAQLGGDVAALDELLDDALVFTAIDGTVVGKNDDLELHRSGRLRISKMEASDLRVLHLGTVAVVSVQMEAEAVLDGVGMSGRLRYTRVWTQRADGWRVIAGHMSVVSAKS
jgi:ketosteroid isomerase-like protein